MMRVKSLSMLAGMIVFMGCSGGLVAKPVKSAPAVVTTSWLIGTWRLFNADLKWEDGCETDVLIHFHTSGLYKDGESQGRFAVRSGIIHYTNRHTVEDSAEEPGSFRAAALPPVSYRIQKIGPNIFSENGERWQRCKYFG
jgi:hypothetical protein